MTDVQAYVGESFALLADRLEQADPPVWDRPSACEGWRVREVVAHVTMAARYGPEEFGAELARHDFDFTRLSDAVAARDGAADPAELLADLRSPAMASWQPPGGGPMGALSHVVIHGADATVRAGLARGCTDHAVRLVLGFLTDGGGASEHFGVALDGRRFEATDLDWSYGAGEPYAAPAADLVLLMSGRR